MDKEAVTAAYVKFKAHFHNPDQQQGRAIAGRLFE